MNREDEIRVLSALTLAQPNVSMIGHAFALEIIGFLKPIYSSAALLNPLNLFTLPLTARPKSVSKEKAQKPPAVCWFVAAAANVPRRHCCSVRVCACARACVRACVCAVCPASLLLCLSLLALQAHGSALAEATGRLRLRLDHSLVQRTAGHRSHPRTAGSSDHIVLLAP